MHDSVMRWGKDMIDSYHLGGDVLEVGSLNVNGSLKPLFTHSKSYLGVDMREGDGVDFVMNSHKLDLDDAIYDTVVCTEVLEHDDKFWVTLTEIKRVLKPKGKLILTTRSNGFQEHGYPSDYYRFMPNSAGLILEMAGCRKLDFQLDPSSPGIFILGERIGSN